jgi:hypothetical protein
VSRTRGIILPINICIGAVSGQRRFHLGETTMTANSIRQVQHYNNILETLQRNVSDGVHIAGGAVRDTRS